MEKDKPLRYDFSCICGTITKTKLALKTHFTDCEIMSLSYQDLVNPWANFIKNGEDIEQLQNLYVLSELVRDRIKGKLKSVCKK